MMLSNIVVRMRGEVPIAWGLIYLVNNILLRKDINNLGISQKIVEQF